MEFDVCVDFNTINDIINSNDPYRFKLSNGQYQYPITILIPIETLEIVAKIKNSEIRKSLGLEVQDETNIIRKVR